MKNTLKSEIHGILEQLAYIGGDYDLRETALKEAKTSLSRVLREHLPKGADKVNGKFTSDFDIGYNTAINEFNQLLGELSE